MLNNEEMSIIQLTSTIIFIIVSIFLVYLMNHSYNEKIKSKKKIKIFIIKSYFPFVINLQNFCLIILTLIKSMD